MGRIEEELGLVSDEEQEMIDRLRNRPFTGEDEHLKQLYRAAKVDISISKIVFEMNEQELSITQVDREVIVLTRKLARQVIFDRWSTLTRLENVQIDNWLAADGIEVCLESYTVGRSIDSIISPPEGYIDYLKKDLQGASYGRTYLGIR